MFRRKDVKIFNVPDWSDTTTKTYDLTTVAGREQVPINLDEIKDICFIYVRDNNEYYRLISDTTSGTTRTLVFDGSKTITITKTSTAMTVVFRAGTSDIGVTDTTLTLSGVPADGKATGDAVNKLKAEIISYNYLASTGDNTDRTSDIQRMLNTTGVCHLGAGKFIVTGVSVPDYAALIGSGDRTVIVLADSVTSGYAVKLNNYSSIFGLRIHGGSTPQVTSDRVGTRHGILFEGTKQSGQSGGATKKRSKIDKCTINNFTGGGIILTGTGIDLDSNLLISDCFVDHCGAGLYIPYYSEYHRICNCSFSYNYYGCVDNGGNNNFANCDFSGNKIGLLIDNSTDQSPNVSHGSFTNCSINHSYSDGGVINEGTAIKLLKANLGEIFTGMQIYYGAIIIDDCVGIRFIGANVGSKVPITITDSTVVTFSDCTFKDAPDHTDSTFTQSGNTVLKFRDCYLRNGTAYDPMN